MDHHYHLFRFYIDTGVTCKGTLLLDFTVCLEEHFFLCFKIIHLAVLSHSVTMSWVNLKLSTNFYWDIISSE